MSDLYTKAAEALMCPGFFHGDELADIASTLRAQFAEHDKAVAELVKQANVVLEWAFINNQSLHGNYLPMPPLRAALAALEGR